MIDGALVPRWSPEKREIMAVATVYLNGELSVQGRMTLDEILNKVAQAQANKQQTPCLKKPLTMYLSSVVAQLAQRRLFYAARKGIRTGVVQNVFGGQVADTGDWKLHFYESHRRSKNWSRVLNNVFRLRTLTLMN